MKTQDKYCGECAEPMDESSQLNLLVMVKIAEEEKEICRIEGRIQTLTSLQNICGINCQTYIDQNEILLKKKKEEYESNFSA